MRRTPPSVLTAPAPASPPVPEPRRGAPRSTTVTTATIPVPVLGMAPPSSPPSPPSRRQQRREARRARRASRGTFVRVLGFIRVVSLIVALAYVGWMRLNVYGRTRVETQAQAMRTQLQRQLADKTAAELDALLDPPTLPKLPEQAMVSRDNEGWRVQVRYTFLSYERCVTVYTKGGSSLSSGVLPECPPLDVNSLALGTGRGELRA